MIPPLFEEELAASFLIATVKVLNIKEIASPEDEDFTVKNFESLWKIMKCEKGDLKKGDEILTKWSSSRSKDPDRMGGPSDITLIENAKFKVYLEKNSDLGYYYAERWNCAQRIDKSKLKRRNWLFGGKTKRHQ